MATSRFPNRTFTYEQLVAAMRSNAYPQANGTLFDKTNGAACAIGQAALNLGVDEFDLDLKLQGQIRSFIVRQNDKRGASPQKIADHLDAFAPKFGGRSFTVKRKDWAATFPGYHGVTVPRGAVIARNVAQA